MAAVLGKGNPLTFALRYVFAPIVKQSAKWPPVLAYGPRSSRSCVPRRPGNRVLLGFADSIRNCDAGGLNAQGSLSGVVGNAVQTFGSSVGRTEGLMAKASTERGVLTNAA